MDDQISVGAFINLQRHEPDVWLAELDHLDGLGLDHVELWLEYEPQGREARDLASVFGGWRTIMHGPFIGMSLASEWSALASLSLDRCHRAVEIAAVIGCEVVTLHAGTYAAHGDHRSARERLASRFARFTSLRSPNVTLENMPARGGATQEALASDRDITAVRRLLPDLQLTLNVGHCVQNDEDPAIVMATHAKHIRNIHLHDGRRAGPAHLPLGGGELNLDAFLDTVDLTGYRGFVTIETLDPNDLAQSLAALTTRAWPSASQSAALAA